MLSRRQFIHGTIFVLGGLVLASCGALPGEEDDQDGPKVEGDQGRWVMPDEGEPHKRTWMAFGASEEIWGKDLVPEVRCNLATIAQTIAKRHAEDLDAYYDIKDPVYDLIWDAASDWSRQIGWKPG